MAEFDHCYFITDSTNTVIIVVPDELPEASTFTVVVTQNNITFTADYEPFANVLYQNEDVYHRLSDQTQIGMVEYDGEGDFPKYITNVAYVEIWGCMQ